MHDIPEMTFKSSGDAVAAHDMLGKVRSLLMVYGELGVGFDVKVTMIPAVQKPSAITDWSIVDVTGSRLNAEQAAQGIVNVMRGTTHQGSLDLLTPEKVAETVEKHKQSLNGDLRLQAIGTDSAGKTQEPADFPQAVSPAQEKPLSEKGQALVARLRKELDSGQRADLRGFRSPVVRSLVAQVMEEERNRVLMENPEAEPFTQNYWNNVKPRWAPRGEMMIKVFDLPWREIMSALWADAL